MQLVSCLYECEFCDHSWNLQCDKYSILAELFCSVCKHVASFKEISNVR